jgi:hypothetical protein
MNMIGSTTGVVAAPIAGLALQNYVSSKKKKKKYKL